MRSDLFASDPDNLLDPPHGKAPIPAEMKIGPLAQLLGCSEVTARRVAVKLPERGLFDVPATLRAYLDRLREQAGRAGRPSVAGGDEYKAERTRLAREQADATALKNAQLRGELVPVADTLREWQAILRDIRAAMLAVPSQFASTQPHLTVHDIAALTDEIKRALEGLADGNA